MTRISALILCVALAPAAGAGEPATLTLTGRGEVTRAPDEATITLGAEVTRPEAAAAMDATSRKAAAILEVLDGAGIAARDVQTAGLTLTPVRRRQDDDGPPGIVAFSAANVLSVRVRDLDDLGRVLDAVADAGANSFRGLAFALAEPGAAEDEARRAAVADAMEKARLYAGAAGVELGAIASMSESRGSQARPTMMASPVPARAGASVPVAGGELTFSARIAMVFELVP